MFLNPESHSKSKEYHSRFKCRQQVVLSLLFAMMYRTWPQVRPRRNANEANEANEANGMYRDAVISEHDLTRTQVSRTLFLEVFQLLSLLL